MKIINAFVLAIIIFIPHTASGEMLGNPGTQIGGKNLFVGIEYTSIMHMYDIDTEGLDTKSERISLKVTTGLTEWLDLFVRAGAANLNLDYKSNDYIYKTSTVSTTWGNASKNFNSDFTAGFGAGTRIRLLNFKNSQTRVFFQGGGFFFKTDNDIRWDLPDGSIITKNREMKWADLYAGLGVSKRMDYIDLTFGLGFSEIWWEISDENLQQVGTSITKNQMPKRDSFEIKSPLFGFIGLDFVLPYEYRISLQAGIRSVDEAEFSIAFSQGLEKD